MLGAQPCRRSPALRSALAALLWTLAVACSNGQTPDPNAPKPCASTKDCPTGQACKQQVCTVLPCDGLCSLDEVCVSNVCRTAEGLACKSDPSVCPTGFVCSPGGKCQRTCTSDDECSTPPFKSCNVEAGFCGECTFDRDCTDRSKPICDPTSATCVGCVDSKDCYESNLGAGKYCDAQTKSCKAGCRTVNDCAPGSKACEGGTSDHVGRCIECRPASEVNDCVNAPELRCDPSQLACVECLSDGDCGAGQCHLPTKKCVQCLTNARCEKGYICDQTSFNCILGCAGGAGGPNCPEANPVAPVCDANLGDHGTCVRCLKDADCPRTTVCDRQGQEVPSDPADPSSPKVKVPACVPGCRDSQTGAPNDARCTTDALPSDVNLVCDGSKGTKGKCVQCTSNASCPSTQACDVGTGLCRCKKEGETCASNAECGYSETTHSCTATGAMCVAYVKCSGSVKSVATKVCARAGTGLPGEQGNCPSGFVSQWACDTPTTCRVECVPNQRPYNCQ